VCPIAAFVAEAFDEKVHTNDRTAFGFRTFGGMLPKKLRKVLVGFEVPMLMRIFDPLLLLVGIFINFLLITFLHRVLWRSLWIMFWIWEKLLSEYS
jgi:hypothetical protein